MVFNVVALVVSALALISSTYLAIHHVVLQRLANYLPAYVGMLSDFRSVSFHDHFRFVTQTLPAEYDPQLGISGLPPDARAAFYDIVYLLQQIAVLRLVGILDERVIAIMQLRIVPVWDAIAPFVERERELHHKLLLITLEDFANEARSLPSESLRTLSLRRQRRRSLRMRTLRRLPQRPSPVTPAATEHSTTQ